MKCPICKVGSTREGLTTANVNIKKYILICKDVPALICNHCGEKYFTNEITKQLHDITQETLSNIIDEEVDKIWEKKGLNQEKLEMVLNTHINRE